ncbi:MAG: hypothetical protein WC695_11540 [Candidatus Omnitrophota bacterium]
MLGKDIFWFKAVKKNQWWQLYFSPLSFSEAFLLLQDSIEAEKIVLVGFGSVINPQASQVIKNLKVPELEFIGAKEGICVFPKKGLLAFKDISQYELDWFDVKEVPSLPQIVSIDLELFKNDISRYAGYCASFGSSILFACREEKHVYMCTRSDGLPRKFLSYMLRSFFIKSGFSERAVEISDALISGLLERANRGLVVGSRDSCITEKGVQFTCWSDSPQESVDACDVTIENKKVSFSGWNSRRNPRYRPVNSFSWVYFALGAVIAAILVFLFFRK